MASNGSAGSDLNDSRRLRDLPLNQNHAYYPRYYPDWQFDPHRLGLAEQEERSYKPNVFPVTYDNVGFYSVPPGSHIGYKDSASSDESSDNFRSGSTRRRCIVVVCIASVVFLIGISVAIGLYFGVYDRPESGRVISSDTRTTTEQPSTAVHTSPTSTSSPPSIVVSYEASLKLDQTYDPALDDPDSTEYRNLKTDVESVVNKNLKSSDLDSAFVKAVVTGFKRGSVEALLKLDFSSNTVVIANRVESLDRTLVENELQQELRKDTTEVNRLDILVDDTGVENLPGTGAADLGQSCSSISDCSDRFTQCTGSLRVCSCIDGYYDSNGAENLGGTCNQKIAYNSSESTRDVCTEARQCITSEAVCRDGVCLCDTTHFYKNDACHPKIGIDSVGCELTAQCATPGAVCIAGTCSCPSDDFYNGNQCTQKISIDGAGCILSSHCATPGAICSDNTCICSPRSHYYDGQSCVMKKFPGQSCSGDQECTESSQCVNNVCQCPSNTYSNGQTCQPKKANGADCLSDIECLVSNSVCDNMSGKCGCTSSTYLDGSVCRNKKGYGEVCSSADECLVTGSICEAGICVCPSTSYLQGTSCINKLANGESCSDVSECLVTNSICSSGTCQCPAFRYLDGISCLNKKLNGEDCASDSECLVTDSICNDISGQCDCPPTRYLNGMTCINKKANGESCSSASECLVTDAVCSSGTCGCPVTKYLEGTTCLTKKLNGDQCLADMECLVTGAVCDGATGTCSCPASMYLDGMTCRNKKQDGELCTSSMECLVENSVCNGGRCGCPANMYLQGMICLSKKANGDSCTSSEECLVTDASCNGGLCGCPSNMFLQGMACLNKKANGESCTSSMQCLVTDSVCNAGLCGCPSSMYLQGMSCMNKKANGEACSSALECLVSSSICNAGLCGCPSTMYLEGTTCMNKKGYNEACVEDMECMSPDFVCRLSVCQCVPGERYDGSMCVATTTTSITQEATTSTEKTTKMPTQKPTTETSTQKSTKIMTTEPPTQKSTTKMATTSTTETSSTTTTVATTSTVPVTTTQPTTTSSMSTTDSTVGTTTEKKPTTSTAKAQTTPKTSTAEPATSALPTTTTEMPTTETSSTTPKRTTSEMLTTKKTTSSVSTTSTLPTTSTVKTTTAEKTSTTISTDSTSSTVSTAKPTTGQPTTTTRIPTTEPLTTTETQKPTTSTETVTSSVPTTSITSSTVSTTESTTGPPSTTETSTTTTDVLTTGEMSKTTRPSTSTTVIMTTSSTAPPPTTVPDEIPTVVLNGTVTSNSPYDPELADTTSDVYQNFSAEFKTAIEDGLRQEGQEGEVTNISFRLLHVSDTSKLITCSIGFISSPEPKAHRAGSIITDYVLVIPVALMIVPETRQDVEELPTKVQELMQPVVDKILTALVNDTKAPAFIKAIDVDSVQPVEVMADPPCKNGITMMDYAEQKVCGEILKYFLNNSVDDTCSTYVSLLDCVSLMYSYDSEICHWNNMRANFENKAKMALGMQEKDTDTCVQGNFYDFIPMAAMKPSAPCMDINLMLHTAKYECHFLYNYMMTEPSVTCRDVKLLESCMMTRLQAHYETCNVTTSVPEYGLTVVVEHQADFFPGHETQLHTCEFCAAPNIEEIMRTNCILPMNVMNIGSFVGSECGHLHSMIMCVEAQASLWTSSNCSVDDIVNVIKSDIDRFYKLFSQIPVFQGGVFALCLDQEIQTIGPELSGNLCNNHNYIAYVFMYECTDWVRLAGGQVYDICSEHLLTTQCVLSHLNDILGLQCTYDGIHRAIWERNYPTNIVDVLQATSFPGSDCYDHYATRSGQCEVTLMSNLAVAYEGCVLFMEEALERKLMTIPEMACGIYAEATRCALREAVVYTDPLCRLEDIEPAMLTGVFRNYPDIQSCPSQGSGPYNREALCQSPNSLGSTYLAFCGEIFTKTNSTAPAPQPCTDLQNFGQCTRQLGTHQDFILSLCDKSELADAFQKLDDTLIQYFAVNQQCFDTNPGQCAAPAEGEDICENPRTGDMSCMLDNECGGLERCCSRGCDMECSTSLDDINPKNGTCPPVDDLTPCPQGTEDRCYVDDHCDGEAKCCYDGCRRYCRDAGGIYTPADCRHPETIQSAILSCSMELTLSYDSCRSFSSLVNCVHNIQTMNSYNRVECQYENTQEDVSVQVRDLFGMNSYCRVYHTWLSVNESGCLDPSIADTESGPGQDYISLITPDLAMIFGGEEFEITAVDFIGGDNCNPVMVQTFIYALTTQTDLLQSITGLINNNTASGELDRDISLIILIYEHTDFNKCTDPPTVLESMALCLPEFNDAGYQYDIWRTCKVVQDLTTCTTEKLASVCDLQELKTSMFMDQREAVLAELRAYGQATHLVNAVARYDYESCEERGDVYPCWDETRIEAAIATCGMDLDLSGLTVNDDVSDMYGVTPQMCRHIYDLMSCATEEIRGLGADCDFGSSYTGELVYKYLRDNIPDGQLLPEEQAQIMMYCQDYMPVCSAIYISQAEESQCYLPYFHDRSALPHLLTDDCNSIEGQAAFREFVTCLRLAALTREENDCTATKIVEIIDNDYQKFSLFKRDTDIAACIGATAMDLDAQVTDSSTVCQSSEALSYFARSCGQGQENCSVAIEDLPDDADLKCNTYFWLVSCVEEMAANMLFSCEAATIASVDLTGTVLEIGSATRQQCESKQDAEFSTCGYPLIRSKSEFEFCYEVLHDVAMFELSPEDTCSLYFDSMYCMKTILTYSPHIPCDPENIDNTIKDFMMDFLEVEAHTEAQMSCSALPNSSYAEQFSNCSAETCEEVLTNTGLLLQSASQCGVNLFTIQRDIKRYTCKAALEKFNCFTGIINEGRPMLYACQATDIINLITQNIEPGQEDDLNFNPYTCSEWTVTVTYYGRYCNSGVVPSDFETDFRNNKLPILMDDLDYEYKKASCGSIKFIVSVYTDLVEEELQRKLDSVIYSNSNFSGETIAIALAQIIMEPNSCQDVEVLKHFAKECVKDEAYNYQVWQVCSPVNHLAYCITEKIYHAANYRCDRQEVMDMLFNNNTQRTQFVSRVERDLANKTMTNRDRLWLDVIKRYSQEKCPDGDSDIYPCEDYEKKLRIYQTCMTQLPPEDCLCLNVTQPNYGLKPENCRYFFSIVSCMSTELHQLGVHCPDIAQYVFERLKEEFDPNFILPDSYQDVELCAAYEPVCSPQFIIGAREMCPWVPDDPHKLLDCRSSAELEVAMNFMTCVRLFALARNQTACTARRIKELIAADIFKLNLTHNSADIDQCWPDDRLSSVLPTRESVCVSGIVVSLVQEFCTPEQHPATPCPLVADSILAAGDLELGCMLYYSQLSCVQTVLANMTFTCSVDQLARAPVAEDSHLFLQENHTYQCFGIFNRPEHQSCEAGLLSDQEALLCTNRLYVLMPVFMTKDQNTTCMLYQESLSCYEDYTRRKGLTCSAQQIHDFQLGVVALSPYGMWPTTECYRPPMMFENCPAVIPEGALCSNTDRLTDVVMGVCTDFLRLYQIPEMSGNKCSLFQSLLWCGTNVTLYIGNECSEEQVQSALLEKNETISAIIPDFDINICSVELGRWFVELLFLNETYSPAMADQTSLAFRRFISMKYYNFISNLADLFSYFELIDLRNFEGKVVLTFYVWSIDEPSYILHNKLVTDYGRDMDNIRIGSVYEDSDKKCSVSFVGIAQTRECALPYDKMRTSVAIERCSHLEQFLGCIMYHALINNEQCTTQKAVELIRETLELEWVSSCPSPDPSFEERFPATKEEICNNSFVHRHLWEYNCLMFDISVVSDPDNRCRTEIGRRSCVLGVLEEANIGCTMNDVIQVSQRPEVRADILNSVESGCETGLVNDTECMMLLTTEGAKAGECFSPLYHFQNMTYMKSLGEINEIPSADRENSLKCSLFEETLLCFISHMSKFDRYGNQTVDCTMADLAPTLSLSHHINYEITYPYQLDDTVIPEISYAGCEASLTQELPTRNCPSLSTVVDLVVGRCGAEVLYIVMNSDTDPCLMYGTFIECVNELHLPNGNLCDSDPFDYKLMALNEYSWYITEVLTGFDFNKCKAERECNDVGSMRERIYRCNHFVDEIRTTGDGEARCQLFEGLIKCMTDDMSREGVDCDYMDVQKIVDDLAKEWMMDSDWSFFDRCYEPVMKCSPEFIERAVYGECGVPYYRMIDSTEEMVRCRHFEGFLGCIKFHALLNNKTCPVQELESMVRERTNIAQFSICKVCNYHWPVITVMNNQAGMEGEVLIQINPDQGLANITMRAYNFNPVSEWFGIGISYDQQMARSDIYTAQMNSSGHWNVFDRYADGRYKPQLDIARNSQNDVFRVTGYMTGDTAVVSFLRPVSTGDEDRDVSLEFDRSLLFARGSLDNNRDIAYHSFRAVSDKPFLFYCDPYSAYELKFPDSKEEVCYNSYVQRHLLEYTCITSDLDVLSDPEDRCRLEISSRGCVMSLLEHSGIDCELGDVTRVSQIPEVRVGLLDSIEPDCESNLEDSECMKKLYVEGWWRAEACFSFFYPFQDLAIIKTEDAVNTMMSVSGNSSLKCSIFREALSCFIRNVQKFATGYNENSSCTAADYAPAITQVGHINYMFWSGSAFIMEANPIIPAEISYNECEVTVTDLFLVEVCPSLESVADLVIGTCSSDVLLGLVSNPGHPCVMEETFTRCVVELHLPQNEMCPEDYIWRAIQKYSGYIAMHMGGFNLTQCQVAQNCKSMEYIETEILPHCKNRTDIFLKYVWEEGCQYFDDLVFCVAQEMEARQMYCNHYEVKDVISAYTHEKTNYDWHYKDNCRRLKWLAELSLNNETFVVEMERNSTDVYKDFLRKYSDMINAILSSFGGGHVVKLYEGSVVVLLSFWAPEDPYDQIELVLQQQFEPDVVNITVGKVTEDEDQNRCLDTVYINEIAIGQCGKELLEVMNATEKCRPVTDLFLCAVRALSMEDIHCNIETIATILTTDLVIGARSLIPDLDLDLCRSLKCSPGYIEKAQHGACAQIYEKMYSSNEDTCRHYQAFLGCNNKLS